jgi:hypothetical protein
MLLAFSVKNFRSITVHELVEFLNEYVNKLKKVLKNSLNQN